MSSVKLPMRCACSAERRAELDAKLPEGATIDSLVAELASGHGYKVRLHADQWFAVEAIGPYNRDDRIYVECDRLIDGLWAILERVGRHEDFT